MPQARANGIDIEYESFGRDSDPLILVIMGLAAQLVFWPKSLCEGLAAKGFRVVRFDNRDIGKSTHLSGMAAPEPRALLAEVASGKEPDVPYALDDMADDAIGLMDALGVGRAHVVGASMGGMIAQLMAINHPARTKSLTSIMSTTGRRDLPPEILTRSPSSPKDRRPSAATTSLKTAFLCGTRSPVRASRKPNRRFAPWLSASWIAPLTILSESGGNGRRSSLLSRATCS
jgi:pimeloyl-ACP methyl ester carboxylesterase